MSLEPTFIGIALPDSGALVVAALHRDRVGRTAFKEPLVLDVADFASSEDLGALGDFLRRYEPRRIVLCAADCISARAIWRIEGAVAALGWRAAVVNHRDVVAEGKDAAGGETQSCAHAGSSELVKLALACNLSGGAWFRHGDRDARALALLSALYASRNAA